MGTSTLSTTKRHPKYLITKPNTRISPNPLNSEAPLILGEAYPVRIPFPEPLNDFEILGNPNPVRIPFPENSPNPNSIRIPDPIKDPSEEKFPVPE